MKERMKERKLAFKKGLGMNFLEWRVTLGACKDFLKWNKSPWRGLIKMAVQECMCACVNECDLMSANDSD